MQRWGNLGKIALLAQANVVIAGITFLTGVLLARSLGPEYRGQFANLVLWPMLICYPATLGVHLELSRRTAREPASAFANYRVGFRILAVTSVIALGIYSAISLIHGNVRQVDPTLTLAAGLMIPFGVWNVFQLQMELGRQNTMNFTLLRTMFALSNMVVVSGLWLAGSRTLVHYLVAFLMASVVSSLGAHAMIARSLPKVADAPASQSALDVMRSARPYAISTILNSITAVADRLLISVFFPARVMGIYVVALAISQIQELVGDAIAQLYFARTAQSKDLSQVDNDWLALRMRQTMAVYFILCCVTLIVAPVMLSLFFGPEFAESTALVYQLLPILALKGASRPLEEILKGGGRPVVQSRIAISTTALFAILGGIAAWMADLRLMMLMMFLTTAGGFVALAVAVSSATGIPVGRLIVPRPKDVHGLFTSLIGPLIARR